MANLAIVPGIGVGFIQLGSGLYDVLTALKSDVKQFPRLDISYAPSEPLRLPVIVDLPDNGIRLRFDGPQQRLRLIEVLSLTKTGFTVKNELLLGTTDVRGQGSLLYRRVYQLFGASYPGEYIPNEDNSSTGTYVVSYPGIALSFSIAPQSFSSHTDHAKMLTETGAVVSSIAIFDGKSWPEVRKGIYERDIKRSMSLKVTPSARDDSSMDVEQVIMEAANRIRIIRRSGDSASIKLGQSTAQDLITDLGPPDAFHKRPSDLPDVTSRPTRMARRKSSNAVPRSWGSTPSSLSSTNTDTYDADFEEDDGIDGPDVVRLEEQYYCYFRHGFDILLGYPDAESTPTNRHASQLVVTRIVLHGNVPGSFQFNRHRRCRWSLDVIDAGITSESFFTDVHRTLLSHYKGTWPEKDMAQGMVIVRDWAGDSPGGSAILVGEDPNGDEEDAEVESWDRQGDAWLKNTQLFKFPGLMFEVMHNGAISALTVYQGA